MHRPEHLPDFTNPPLDEVVLGVQFAPMTPYTAIDSRDVWGLFKDEFPKVQEQPLLQPQFETFGGPNFQQSFQFQVGASQAGSRLWFVSEQENHLLQFQSDRFLINWRKKPNPQPYPHFEGIAESFESNLVSLDSHFATKFHYHIEVNQAEVTYINIIPVEEFSEAGKWFSVWCGSISNVEGLNTSFNEVISDEGGKPFARLFHVIQSVYSIDGRQKAYNLSLTFRGKPSGGDISSAMQFLRAGREAIVVRFKQITTQAAHKYWGIIR
jgi:uncharacterized protein (TIGR04255 family)